MHVNIIEISYFAVIAHISAVHIPLSITCGLVESIISVLIKFYFLFSFLVSPRGSNDAIFTARY